MANSNNSGGTLAGILGAGVPLIGGAINSIFQDKQNTKNQQHDEHLYKMQRDDNVKFWEMQNNYNSPEQQMQRLQAAGLNPNMVYGNGSAVNTAGSISNGSPHSSAGIAPKIDLQTPVEGYFNAQQKQATLSNMAKQGDLLQAEIELKRANTVNTLFNNDLNAETRPLLKEQRVRKTNLMGFDEDIKSHSLSLMEQQLKNMIASKMAIDLDNQNRIKKGVGFNLDNDYKSINNQVNQNELKTQMGGVKMKNVLPLIISLLRARK